MLFQYWRPINENLNSGILRKSVLKLYGHLERICEHPKTKRVLIAEVEGKCGIDSC